MYRHRTLLPAISALFLILACLPAWAVAPTVTNVQAHQWQDKWRKVQITYYLTDPDTANVYVSVAISTDGGSTYSITPTTLTGDTGWVRPGGRRTIIWNAKADYPDAVWTNCYAKVTADDSINANLALFKPVSFTVSGDNPVDPHTGENAQDVTDGSLEYQHCSYGIEDGVVGWQNVNDGVPMVVTVTINLLGTYEITRVRYNVGNVLFGDAWNADTMAGPFGTTATNPGGSYSGAWTEQTGHVTSSFVVLTFTKTKVNYYTDWMFIGEVEVYGTPAGM